MNPKTRAAIILFLLLFILIIIFKISFLELIEPDIIISGITKGANESPISDVLLTLENNLNGDIKTAISGIDGSFSFAPIPAGDYGFTLTGTKPMGDGAYYSGKITFTGHSGPITTDLILDRTIF